MKLEVAGETADPSRLPSGCAFHPRCNECFAPCRENRPALRDMGNGHAVACHLHPGK
jgi:oligopeptide/dipeptide ABC transporter ATP-binding protein